MANIIPTKVLKKYPDVCRICLSNEAVEKDTPEELLPIEDIYVQRCHLTESVTSFRDMLTIFVNDEINVHGKLLPTSICLNCARRAQEAYTFIEQCRRTDQLLESHFSSLRTVEIEKEEIQPEEDVNETELKTETGNPEVLADQTVWIAKEEDGEGKLQKNTNPNRFYCDKCNKSFTQSQTLRRHKRSHDQTGSNLKTCTHCAKTFLRSDDLTRHIRTHTGERPYKCTLCTKAYKQWSELNEHCLTHKAHKLFECSECFKKLASRNGLYVHMKVHRGDKAFVCEHCSKRFTTSCALTAHVRRIHISVHKSATEHSKS